MIEREEPEFIKFADKGEIVEGVLETIERVAIQGRPVTRYTVQRDGGSLAQFLGAHQINTKLRMGDKGHRVSVAYIGDDVTVRRGENCMKVFRVLVSADRVGGSDPLEITDADIPF